MSEVTLGIVDRSVFVFIPDPASTDGSGKTGLVAANLTVSYSRMETDNDATVTDVTGSLSDLAALTTAHTDWGVKEISSTLAPGLYRLDCADAVFAAGAWYAVVYVMITTSAAAASPIQFELVAFDPLDSVRLGLTALPNAAAGANGGLPLGDASGRVDVIKVAGTTQTAGDIIGDTNDIQARLPAALVSGRIDASVGAMAAGVVTATAVATGAIDADALATDAVNEIVDQVWDELIAGHAVSGSTGEALSAAGSAGDPWITDLPGAYTGIQAGKIIGDNLNATVSSRLASASYTTPPTVGAIADQVWEEAIADHDGTVGSTAEALSAASAGGSAPTADQNADALLDRTNAIETGLTPRQALRLTASALAGELSGAGSTTITFRNAVADSKDRIVATVDGTGNRTAITTDVT